MTTYPAGISSHMSDPLPIHLKNRGEWRRRLAGFALTVCATAANLYFIAAIMLSKDIGPTAMMFVVPVAYALGIALSGSGGVTPSSKNRTWTMLESRNMLNFVTSCCITAILRATVSLATVLSQTYSGFIAEMVACCLYLVASIHCARYFRKTSARRLAAAIGERADKGEIAV